jgi:hypothetical protein
MTAIAAAIDAAMLMRLYPNLAWLAAACATVASYGLWGVLDRALRPRAGGLSAAGVIWIGLRDLTAIFGTGSALCAAWAVMAMAIGNWIH